MANRTWATLKAEVAEYAGRSDDRAKYLADRALRAALNKVNRRGVWWFLFTVTSSTDDTTFVSGTRAYAAPATTPMNVHVASVILDVAGTKVSSDVRYVNEEDFYRLWWNTTDTVGQPWVMTYAEASSQWIFNRDPGTAFNGRKVRHAYYKLLSVPSDTTNGTLGIPDEAEDYIVDEAVWRLKREARVPGGWQNDKALADEEEKQLLAAHRSIDLASYGITR